MPTAAQTPRTGEGAYAGPGVGRGCLRLSLVCAAVDVELEPEQPEEVSRAVEELLAERAPAPDPWWQAGIEEAIGP